VGKFQLRIVFTLLISFWASVSPSDAATMTFQNCKELNKVYPGGVALPGAVNSGSISKKSPEFNKNLYLANKKSDRDKDGIACEK
jgi:hypothetical protein